MPAIIDVPDDSSDDDGEQSSGSDFDQIFEYEEDVLKNGTYHLGLAKGYSPTWLPKDAFREFYQNWYHHSDHSQRCLLTLLRKDGIIATNGIDPRSFKPVLRATQANIFIELSAEPQPGQPNTQTRLLGFISFNKKSGIVKMTNFKAKLEMKHLYLGETSKRRDDRMAGCHGEGFKLAALVMKRNGHSVRFETNRFKWNFGFTGKPPNLRCRLSESNPEKVEERRRKYLSKVGTPKYKRGRTANIWEDVTLQIGKTTDNLDESELSEEEFRLWLTVTIDLDCPPESEIVRTREGDLILDPQYRGRIYLRGLRVDGCGPDGRDYYFGYNFYSGDISRDRERLTNKQEEARMLARIWEDAIQLHGDKITDHYIGLFSADEELPDVTLASTYVSVLTAKTIFRRLRTLNKDAFFFSEQDQSETSASKDVSSPPHKHVFTTDLLYRKTSSSKTSKRNR